MASAAPETQTYIICLTDQPQDPETPWLHERWCWEGDETPLPKKWSSMVLADADCIPANDAWLQSNILSKSKRMFFDPQGFFFLTSR